MSGQGAALFPKEKLTRAISLRRKKIIFEEIAVLISDKG